MTIETLASAEKDPFKLTQKIKQLIERDNTLGLSVPVPVSKGGTGQTTEAEAIGEMVQALATEGSPDPAADYIPIYDASADTGKKVLINQVGVSTPVSVANGGTGQTTEAESVGELTQALSEDTTPDWLADYIPAYDASADTGKKLLLSTVWREKVASNRTYYIRSDGDDANNGLTDSAGGAFLTIQKFCNIVGGLDLASGVVVTGQVRNGTFSEAIQIRTIIGAGSVVLQGDTTTPSNVIVNPASGACFTAFNIAGSWTVQGFKATSANTNIFNASGPSVALAVGNMEYGGATTAIFSVSNGAILTNSSSTSTISGDFAYGAIVSDALLIHTGNTYTISGRRNMTSAFMNTEMAGRIRGFSNTYKGALTFTADAGTDRLTTSAAHGLSSNDPVQLQNTGGGLPGGTGAGTIYYVISVDATNIQISASSGPGAAVDITSAGTGTHTIFCVRTGKKFEVTQNGLIVTNGAGAGYFPGAVAGTGDPGTYDGYV